MTSPTGAPGFGAVLASWTAPFGLAASGFGAFLVVRNSTAGVPWTSPAIFCGAPAAVFLLTGGVAGLLIYLLFGRSARAGSRLVRAGAAVAACVAFSLVGYHTSREYKIDVGLRYACGLGAGLAAAIAAWSIGGSRWARPVAALSLAIAISSVAAGALAIYTIRRPAPAAAAGPADPRDFIPKFDPVASAPKRGPHAGRVFLLGIDGATWDKIDPLIQQKRLPHFETLRKDGATARLKTIVPTASPTIWTTIATGHLPSDHGIQDFVVRRTRFLPSYALVLENRPLRTLFSFLDLYTVVPVTSNFRRTKAIWNLATEMNIPIGSVGWWASYPAEIVKGWIVSDATSHAWVRRLMAKHEQLETRAMANTFPEELAAELAPLHRNVESITKEELGRFMQLDDTAWSDFHAAADVDKESPLSIWHSAFLRDEFFVASALEIEKRYKPEILFCYTRFTDDIAHFFWEYSEAEARELGRDPKRIARYKDTVDRSYEWADAIVGKFMERLGPGDTLVVCSDHGWERAGRGMYHHNNGPDGIIAFYGSSAKPGHAIGGTPHILDVAPTLLWLAGIPKGADMAGTALRDAFVSPPEEKTIPTWETSSYRTGAAIEMLDAAGRVHELEQLGYVGGKK